ncbi:MAG: hypothetical protein JXQ91_04760 [Vannielia sp.]|uniref:hypothetical protein n=1 Tax=Vannielia sp. TaxID=2813045 RepID=UPI003B8BD185
MGTRFSPKYGYGNGGGADDFIRESCVGWGNPELTFPGVSSCSTITLRDGAGNLSAVHLTKADSVITAARLLETARANLPGAITGILHVGGLNLEGSGWVSQPDFVWPQRAATIRRLLQVPNAATYYIDTGLHASDVRVVASAGGAFDVSMKPESHYPADYVNGWNPYLSHRLV